MGALRTRTRTCVVCHGVVALEEGLGAQRPAGARREVVDEANLYGALASSALSPIAPDRTIGAMQRRLVRVHPAQ